MTDTFRKEYKTLSEEHSNLITDIKTVAEAIEKLMMTVVSREMSVALTTLETAIMWATKAVVLSAEQTNRDTNE